MTCFHPNKKLYLAVSRNHVDLIIKAHIQTTRTRVELSLCELGEGQGLDRERVQRIQHANRHQYQAFHFHFIYVLIILKCMYFLMLISLKWKKTISFLNLILTYIIKNFIISKKFPLKRKAPGKLLSFLYTKKRKIFSSIFLHLSLIIKTWTSALQCGRIYIPWL